MLWVEVTFRCHASNSWFISHTERLCFGLNLQERVLKTQKWRISCCICVLKKPWCMHCDPPSLSHKKQSINITYIIVVRAECVQGATIAWSVSVWIAWHVVRLITTQRICYAWRNKKSLLWNRKWFCFVHGDQTPNLSKQTSPDRNKTLEKERTELQNIWQTSIAARNTESLNLE